MYSDSREKSIILVIFAVGFITVIMPYFGYHLQFIPGNLGDARFNNYILEHGYKWLSGTASSFWNAPFFFPVPNTIAFSDNHIGSLLIYSVMRVLGFGRETSYQMWILVGITLNFFSMAWVLKKIGARGLGLACGAFLFAFSLAYTSQLGHAQLTYRFASPLAWFFFCLFLTDPKPRHLGLSLIFCVLQLYCTLYIGYFLLLFLGSFCVGMIITHGYQDIKYKVLHNLGKKKKLECISLLILSVIALLPLILPYIQIGSEYGYRSWSEISSMLPRLSSYLLPGGSFVWGNIFSNIGADIPMRWEHLMWIGAVPWISVFYFVFLTKKKDFKKDMVSALIISLGIMIIITLYFKGNSLYYILTRLPGVSAFRAVTRIILIMLIPFSIILASFISSLIERTKRWDRPLLRVFFVSLVFVFFLGENQNAPFRFSKNTAQKRIASLLKKISKKHINHNSVLAYIYTPTESWWVPALDAMLAAQELNIATLNGYSGKFPRGKVPIDSCYALNIVISNYLRQYPKLSDQTHKLKDSLIVVNSGHPCTIYFASSTIDYPLPTNAYKAAISVKPENIEIKPGESFGVQVYVKNESQFLWPAAVLPSGRFEIRLSYRWINTATNQPLKGFDNRRQMPHDIAPKDDAEIPMTIKAPEKPGHYLLQFDLVQELVAWFHDRGSPFGIMKVVVSER